MLGSDCLRFTLVAQDPSTRARLGRLELPHGLVETPVFMPVGTQGTVKGILPRDLLEGGATIILANTYHLALRPGPEIVRDAGGLHGFMSWTGPILTDSGGFQVFSLASLNRIGDDGVSFRSHIDGDLIHLSPERSIEIQNALGADIIMAFDECPPHPASREVVERAVERTAAWAARCAASHARGDQALFGIVQGGIHEDLRRRSVEQIASLDFPGCAIGGVSVGESPLEMRSVVDFTAPLLPEDRPRYVMGVGGPEDIVDMVASGVDMFDCVLPTRNARNACLFTRQGVLRMRNQSLARDFTPVEADCGCATCRGFTRAYLRHLYTRDEMLGGMLGTIHNLAFFHRLLRDIRSAIREGMYGEFRERFLRESRAASSEQSALDGAEDSSV
ncbi:MAG TPA: tRNA guanosine(34) transglycosylase Tgt [Planctomycetota bacterium]|jgi:queuine tRNA-ribosyltransferase|nr:tRNA guanosine(34) transglycosylase Tgt [Planctomycetota bacterium]